MMIAVQIAAGILLGSSLTFLAIYGVSEYLFRRDVRRAEKQIWDILTADVRALPETRERL